MFILFASSWSLNVPESNIFWKIIIKTEKLQEFILECLFIYLCQVHLGDQIAEDAPWLNKAYIIIIIIIIIAHY